jgi:arylsulfatase A-like enzyme
MSEYTDVQFGRVVDYLEKTGQLAADNGTFGEGTPSTTRRSSRRSSTSSASRCPRLAHGLNANLVRFRSAV